MKINYFVHTEIGDRPCNEDRYAVSKCPAGLCFALADGLGVAAHNSCQKWRTTHVKAYLCI